MLDVDKTYDDELCCPMLNMKQVHDDPSDDEYDLTLTKDLLGLDIHDIFPGEGPNSNKW